MRNRMAIRMRASRSARSSKAESFRCTAVAIFPSPVRRRSLPPTSPQQQPFRTRRSLHLNAGVPHQRARAWFCWDAAKIGYAPVRGVIALPPGLAFARRGRTLPTPKRGNHMFQNTALDVAIGLILMYLMLSLLCTTINEYIATKLKLRAKTLADALHTMLDDPKLRNTFYQHGLIVSNAHATATGAQSTYSAVASLVSPAPAASTVITPPTTTTTTTPATTHVTTP